MKKTPELVNYLVEAACLERNYASRVLKKIISELKKQSAQQSFAVGQLPLCPECGETLLEDDRRWECVNESCGNCR